MIPIPEQLEIPYNISVALNLCYLCIPASTNSIVALYGGNYVMIRIQLLFSTTTLFVRTELLCSSIRRLPSNRTNSVAVFEGSPFRYNSALLYRIGLPSNTATPLVLFGGSLRIKLRIEIHSSSIRTNRAIVLKSNCIRSTTYFPLNRASLSMVILDYRVSKDSVLLT